MVQPFKIGSVPAGQQSTIQQNSTELLYEVYKNSPILHKLTHTILNQKAIESSVSLFDWSKSSIEVF